MPGMGRRQVWETKLLLVLVGGFGSFLEFVVDLFEKFLGFCGVALHVPLIGSLGSSDFFEGLC